MRACRPLTRAGPTLTLPGGPGADTVVLAAYAGHLLRRLWKPGTVYHKAGVMLNGLKPPSSGQQLGLFAALATQAQPRPVVASGRPQLMATLDHLNARYGRGAPALAGIDLVAERRLHDPPAGVADGSVARAEQLPPAGRGTRAFFVAMLRFWLLLFAAGCALPGVAQSAPAVVTLPFDLVAGVIVLRHGQLNGQRGDFLLDTGCTYGLLVEQAAFTGQLRPSTKRGFSGAGSVPLYELPVTQFALGGLRPHPATARATSLAALQAAIGGHLLGILGTELLRQYEVVIDYVHRRLSFYPLGRGSSPTRPFSRTDSVAFTLEQGWPVAVAFFDSVPVQLLLDTGSQDNHLDADFARNLPMASRPTGGRRATLVVPGGHLAGQRATLPALQVGTTTWRKLPVVLAPPVRYASGHALPYQGILGGTFLSQEPLRSFHYGRRQLYTLTPK